MTRFNYNERKTPPASPPAPPVDPTKLRVYDEVARVKRMTCKDFLWEYDLMKKIAKGKLYPSREYLFRATLAMYLVQEKVGDQDLARVETSLSAAVKDTAEQCRARPEASYFTDVLAPTLMPRRQAERSARAVRCDVDDL